MIQQYYKVTPRIIQLSAEVGRILGIADATHLRKPMTESRQLWTASLASNTISSNKEIGSLVEKTT